MNNVSQDCRLLLRVQLLELVGEGNVVGIDVGEHFTQQVAAALDLALREHAQIGALVDTGTGIAGDGEERREAYRQPAGKAGGALHGGKWAATVAVGVEVHGRGEATAADGLHAAANVVRGLGLGGAGLDLLVASVHIHVVLAHLGADEAAQPLAAAAVALHGEDDVAGLVVAVLVARVEAAA